MAQHEDGWPLGLRLMNARVGLMGNYDLDNDISASVSFNTLLTHSSTSLTDSSSDLDTQSTGSFYHDKSITLGSLIGISSILELSQASTKGNEVEILNDKKKHKFKPWLHPLSLCIKLHPGAVGLSNSLETDTRAASSDKTHNDFSPTRPVCETKSLSVDDQVAPSLFAPVGEERSREFDRELDEDGNSQGIPLLFSCLHCQLIK